MYFDNTTWEKTVLRYGLVVRIPGSHPGGPGSIPGNGKFFSSKNILKKFSTRMGFEPTRAEPIGLAVQRLNHSATSSFLIAGVV